MALPNQTPLKALLPPTTLAINLALLLAVLSARLLSAADVSFSQHVAPILQQKCVTCHDAEKSKGTFRLDTFERLLKPGDSGKQPIEPNAPDKSHLFQLLVTTDEDDRMPQKADPLPPEQIATIRAWIEQGAHFDGPDPAKPLITLLVGPRAKPPEKYPTPQPVLALAWNSAGDIIASSGYHEVLLWQTNGALARRVADIPQRIHGLAFAGPQLAIAGGTPGAAGEVLLVEDNDVRLLLRIADEIISLATSPNGNLLAAGGSDNSIHLFELPSGKEIRLLQQHADWVTALAFSNDGKRLASASRDRTARLFDIENGNLLETYAEHDQLLYAVALSPDAKTAMSAGRERKIHLWSTTDAKKTGDLPAGNGNVTELLTLGERTFIAGAEKNITVFKGKKEERKLQGHQDWVYSLAAHEHTARLASGSYDGEIRLWNIETGELLATFNAAP